MYSTLALLGALSNPASAQVTRCKPLDLVFAVDTTGSMAEVLSGILMNSYWLEDSLADLDDVRVAVLEVNESPSGQAYVSLRQDFDSDLSLSQTAMDQLYARAGGDVAEPYALVLDKAASLDWREKDSVEKRVILLSDSVGKDPNGSDIYQVLNQAPFELTVFDYASNESFWDKTSLDGYLSLSSHSSIVQALEETLSRPRDCIIS